MKNAQKSEKVWVEVSKEKILSNIKLLKELLQEEGGIATSRAPRNDSPLFMAVVKSNAYGHGLAEVSKICSSREASAKWDEHKNCSTPRQARRLKPLVDWFGVDNIDEALALREQGIKQPILILGYVPFDKISEAVAKDISFVAYNNEALDFIAAQKFPKNKKAKIHIKVETGTARQGIEGKELLDFVSKAVKNPNIFIEGIYTHYANIEDTTDSSYAIEQLKKFNKSIAAAEKIVKIPLKHSACSAALINYPETQFNLVRAGISLYGMWSSNETKLVAKQKNINLILKPALTWQTQIVQIKKIPAGTPVSYGLTEKVKRESRIAILPVGYWDGYDRGLSGIGEVLVNGCRARILGRICMNMTIIDITDIPDAELFDSAILLGKSGEEKISAEEIAKKINTINYEITTRINPLIKRIIS